MSSRRDDWVTLHHSDCLDVLITLEDNSIDAVITDPPFAMSFRGHDWDTEHPNPGIWEHCRRVLKPGAYLLSFGGCRTWQPVSVRH
jgi:DNA modification methylase